MTRAFHLDRGWSFLFSYGCEGIISRVGGEGKAMRLCGYYSNLIDERSPWGATQGLPEMLEPSFVSTQG